MKGPLQPMWALKSCQPLSFSLKSRNPNHLSPFLRLRADQCREFRARSLKRDGAARRAGALRRSLAAELVLLSVDEVGRPHTRERRALVDHDDRLARFVELRHHAPHFGRLLLLRDDIARAEKRGADDGPGELAFHDWPPPDDSRALDVDTNY